MVMIMYDNLIAELARKHISKKQVWQMLGISAGTLRNKLSKTGSDFTITEIKQIYSTYFENDKRIDLSYLCEFQEQTN